MQMYAKELSDTDSIYCAKPTNSHQSSIFIGPTDGPVACGLFGSNYVSDMDVVIEISRDNLLLNVLFHYLGSVKYKKRGTSENWNFNKNWLSEKQLALYKAFTGATAKFHVSINKEATRTYLKGIAGVRAEDSTEKLDIRNYLFSGDTLRMGCKDDGTVVIAVADRGGENQLFDSVMKAAKMPKAALEMLSADRLPVALKIFQCNRGGGACLGGQHLMEALRQEFIDWCVKVDGKKEITPKTYLPPLESVSMPMEVESMKSSWNGVYEFIYGKKPAKHVLEITTAAELDEVYGELLKVYAAKDSPMPEGVSAPNWNKVRAWVKADKAKGRSSVILHESAFKKYRQFLEWREANGGANGGPNGWASYDAWAKAARETFAKVDAGMLIASDFDYMEFARKFVYNPTVANVYFKDHDANARAEVGNFISENRESPKAASWYLEKDNLPNAKGFGVGCALNFMMKVRPAEFATYSPMIDGALMFVGLLAKPLPADPTVVSYEQNKSLQGQVLAKMHELRIGKAADDDSAADYLTVNEFAWWLSDENNKDLIKKEVLKMSVKPVKHDKRPNEERKELKLNLGEKDDRLMLRLMAALRTKPFAILAGHSGTGKSRMVRRLAHMTCRDGSLRDEQTGKVGNFCMIQVKPNWHDSTDLLGYYSSMGGSYQPTEFVKFIEKAYAYPHVPFFVCLDEMNLAPVEQYFAEYLSAIESMRKNASGEFVSDPIVAKDVYRDIKGLEPEFTESVAWLEKYGLTIPRNLFVVGTVNMDETTNEFSRKVLDRAMTIEMTDVAFENFKKTSPEPTFADCLKDEPIDNLMGGEVQAADLSESQLKNLNAIKAVLASTAFAVAYRFANEYALYADSLARFNGGNDSAAFDHMVLMKVLPRIAGDSVMVKKIFAGLKGVLSSETESHKKMEEIEERDGEDLTFWP